MCFVGGATIFACGLIWPIAGIIYPVVVIFVKIYERK